MEGSPTMIMDWQDSYEKCLSYKKKNLQIQFNPHQTLSYGIKRPIIAKTILNNNNNNNNDDNNGMGGSMSLQISSHITDLFWSLFLFLMRKYFWKEYDTGEKEFIMSALPQGIRWALITTWRKKTLKICSIHLHNCKLAMIVN